MILKYKKQIIIFVAVVAVLFIAGMAYNLATNYIYHDEEHTLVSSSNEKIIAPDFTVFDIENEEVHLSEHIGSKTVVSFWATWCGPCKSMLKDFNEIYTEKNDDVEFMMINLTDGMDETVEVAKQYIRNKEYTVPVYFDLAYSAVHEYDVSSLPVTVFIDENGYISNIHQGSLSKSQIKKYIKAIGNGGVTLE